MYDGTLGSGVLNLSASALDAISNTLSFLTSQTNSLGTLIKNIDTVKESLDKLTTTYVSLNPFLSKASAEAAKHAAATQADTAASTGNAAATQAETTATALNTAATQADTVAENNAAKAKTANNTATGLGTALMGALTGTVTLHTLATTAATAATNLFKMALNALPLVAIATAVTAIITAIVALVKQLSAGSAAFQAQKKEVEELASAQEEMAQSAQDSAAAFDDSFARIQASGTVAQGLVNQMRDVSSSTADAADKHQQMAALCTQLNSAMDGLNLAYDKETGAITIPPPRGHRSDCLNLKQAPEIQDFRGLLQCFGRISIQLSAWRTAERDERL